MRLLTKRFAKQLKGSCKNKNLGNDGSLAFLVGRYPSNDRFGQSIFGNGLSKTAQFRWRWRELKLAQLQIVGIDGDGSQREIGR
jgi:hypothetical protein